MEKGIDGRAECSPEAWNISSLIGAELTSYTDRWVHATLIPTPRPSHTPTTTTSFAQFLQAFCFVQTFPTILQFPSFHCPHSTMPDKSSNLTLIFACILAGLVGPILQTCFAPAKDWIQGRWEDSSPAIVVDTVAEKWQEAVVNHQTESSTPLCQNAGYIPRIVMQSDPFMMHIENFINAEERAYLLELG